VGGRLRVLEGAAGLFRALVCFADERRIPGQQTAALVVGHALGVQRRLGDGVGVGHVVVVDTRLAVAQIHHQNDRDQGRDHQHAQQPTQRQQELRSDR
jgi:hypothetical protein